MTKIYCIYQNTHFNNICITKTTEYQILFNFFEFSVKSINYTEKVDVLVSVYNPLYISLLQ